MRLDNRCAACLAGLFAFVFSLSVHAQEPLLDRCVALKERLASIDCRQGFRELGALLRDTKTVFGSFQLNLERDSQGVTALASTISRGSDFAKDCLVKHVGEGRPFDQAYLGLVELHGNMESRFRFNDNFPRDVLLRHDRFTTEKYDKASSAVDELLKTW